jgi:hypothetical protein
MDKRLERLEFLANGVMGMVQAENTGYVVFLKSGSIQRLLLSLCFRALPVPMSTKALVIFSTSTWLTNLVVMPGLLVSYSRRLRLIGRIP